MICVNTNSISFNLWSSLLFQKMLKYLTKTRNSLGSTSRSIATTDLVNYRKYGYVLLPGQLSSKKIEPLQYASSRLLKSISEYTCKEIIPEITARTTLQDDCMFFSGGKVSEAAARNVKLTNSVRGLVGEGISALLSHLHDDIEDFWQVARSKVIKQVVQEIFFMKAPLIAASLYVDKIDKTWSNIRKDNAYIRTIPLSTQVALPNC
eukprot:TRINITY_DN7829_c0_g5_i1.p1 TRINITY_DN7829_c0_g5~~TRINITY_DN7829_c0_g5_i1.p1  ORF type:complete len:207 (+),score=18.09 TRINITY_DN7829_c0_g5_i1:851-1471(+)